MNTEIVWQKSFFVSTLYGPLRGGNMQRNHILPNVILFSCLIAALKGTMVKVIICFHKRQH